MKPGLRKALVTWAGRAEEAAQRMLMVKRAAASFRQPGLRKALTRWVEEVIRILDAFDTLNGAMNSIRMSGARKAINSWRDSTNLLRELRKHGSALIHQKSRLGFNTWLEFANSKKEKYRKLKQAASSLRSVGLRR